MAVVKVQSVNGNGASVTLNSVVAANGLTSQSAYFRNASTGVAMAIPTDTNGTFEIGRSDAPQILTGHDDGVGGFFEKNCASGTHTVTPEASGYNNTLTEWSGLDTVSPLITGNSGKNSGTGTSQATGASASASSGDLAIISFGMSATTTGTSDVGFTDPVSGYTTLSIVKNDATDVATMHCSQILSSGGTQNATFNWTASASDQFWQASIFILKTAAVAEAISPANIVQSVGRYIGWVR